MAASFPLPSRIQGTRKICTLLGISVFTILCLCWLGKAALRFSLFPILFKLFICLQLILSFWSRNHPTSYETQDMAICSPTEETKEFKVASPLPPMEFKPSDRYQATERREGVNFSKSPVSKLSKVLEVTNFVPDALLCDCDQFFRLFRQYGNVRRVKVLPSHGHPIALIQMKNYTQAVFTKEMLQGASFRGKLLVIRLINCKEIEYTNSDMAQSICRNYRTDIFRSSRGRDWETLKERLGKPSKTLFVIGFGKSYSDEDIVSVLSEFGKVVEMRRVRDKNHSWVEMASVEEAIEVVINLDVTWCKDGKMFVQFERKGESWRNVNQDTQVKKRRSNLFSKLNGVRANW